MKHSTRCSNEEAVDAFRNRALNPEKPVLHGTAQNYDIFFQAREASNKYYEATLRYRTEVHGQGKC